MKKGYFEYFIADYFPALNKKDPVHVYVYTRRQKKSWHFEYWSLLFDCQYLRQFFIKSSNQVQF